MSRTDELYWMMVQIWKTTCFFASAKRVFLSARSVVDLGHQFGDAAGVLDKAMELDNRLVTGMTCSMKHFVTPMNNSDIPISPRKASEL